MARHKYEVAATRAQVAREQRQKKLVKGREYPEPSLELWLSFGGNPVRGMMGRF